MRPSEAVALCRRDSLIITIGINFPKLNEDKELQAHSAWRGSFWPLFSNWPACFGHFDDAHIGFDGAVGVLIYKDFYEMWHRGLAQRR
jgi:hypothetical protein